MWDWIHTIISLLALFLGVAAYVNSEKLRNRLNRMQDVLEEKKVTNRYELIPDKETRDLILKNRGDRPLSEMVASIKKEHEKNEVA